MKIKNFAAAVIAAAALAIVPVTAAAADSTPTTPVKITYVKWTYPKSPVNGTPLQAPTVDPTGWTRVGEVSGFIFGAKNTVIRTSNGSATFYEIVTTPAS